MSRLAFPAEVTHPLTADCFLDAPDDRLPMWRLVVVGWGSMPAQATRELAARYWVSPHGGARDDWCAIVAEPTAAGAASWGATFDALVELDARIEAHDSHCRDGRYAPSGLRLVVLADQAAAPSDALVDLLGRLAARSVTSRNRDGVEVWLLCAESDLATQMASDWLAVSKQVARLYVLPLRTAGKDAPPTGRSPRLEQLVSLLGALVPCLADCDSPDAYVRALDPYAQSAERTARAEPISLQARVERDERRALMSRLHRRLISASKPTLDSLTQITWAEADERSPNPLPRPEAREAAPSIAPPEPPPLAAQTERRAGAGAVTGGILLGVALLTIAALLVLRDIYPVRAWLTELPTALFAAFGALAFVLLVWFITARSFYGYSFTSHVARVVFRRPPPAPPGGGLDTTLADGVPASLRMNLDMLAVALWRTEAIASSGAVRDWQTRVTETTTGSGAASAQTGAGAAASQVRATARRDHHALEFACPPFRARLTLQAPPAVAR